MASLLVHSPPSHDSLYADGSEKLLGVPDASSWHPPAGSKDPPRSATPRSGGGPEKRPSLLAMLQDYWWLIVIVCLLVLTVLWQLMVWHAFRGRSAATCTQQIGGDYLGVEPTFDTRVVQWWREPDFVPLHAVEYSDPKVKAKWDTMYPAGAGNLPGKESGLKEYNLSSVTHQLHCVYFMGKLFSAVWTKSDDVPTEYRYERHFLHCVDILRQAVMCAGDLTVVTRNTEKKAGAGHVVEPYHGQHVCKDYNQVRTYLEKEIRDGKRYSRPLDMGYEG